MTILMVITLITNNNMSRSERTGAIERDDAEVWLQENKDVWNHPRIIDRTNKESHELADLMAEFANHCRNKILNYPIIWVDGVNIPNED